MTMENMLDLVYEFQDDGTVRLEQTAGSPEGAACIDLHPMQLRMLAEQAGLLEPMPMVQPRPLDSGSCDEMQHIAIERDDDRAIHLYQTQLHGMGGSDEHVILRPIQATLLAYRLLALATIKPAPIPVVGPAASTKRGAPETGKDLAPGLFG